LGYPLLVESNAVEPLCIAAESWGAPHRFFEAPPLHLTIHVNKSDPPVSEPAYQASADGFSLVCDPSNRAEFSIRAHAACLHISRAVLDRPEWFRHQLLECLVLTALDTVYFVGLHAACVVPPGNRKPGVLLCGVSGSGKSTLAYACARAGWTYITDDGSYLVNNRTDRLVVGNFNQMRFRPSAVELFAELKGKEIMKRAQVGKPSIEMSTSALRNIEVSPTSHINHVVFLNWRNVRRQELVRFPTEVAKYSMLQVLYGMPSVQKIQRGMIDNLLDSGALELRYSDLDWAVDRLARLAEEGM